VVLVATSSSTKKAARLAQKGQGKKIRFQGGTLFPMVVAVVVVLGLLLVVYSRQSQPAADASEPTIDQHWHAAYGFYLCDEWFQLSGALEESDSTGFLNTDYARTGVHSHEDGVIHWHPFSSAATGRNATLGVFLENYGVELSNDTLVFPEEQRPLLPYQQETGVFENDETSCEIDGNEEDAALQVVVWDNFSDTDSGTTYIADFNNIRLTQDAMVFTIAFVPNGTDVEMPPWAPELPALGAEDTNYLSPEDLEGQLTDVTVLDGDSETPHVDTGDEAPADTTGTDSDGTETDGTETDGTDAGG
jgi:hypothetical protein